MKDLNLLDTMCALDIDTATGPSRTDSVIPQDCGSLSGEDKSVRTTSWALKRGRMHSWLVGDKPRSYDLTSFVVEDVIDDHGRFLFFRNRTAGDVGTPTTEWLGVFRLLHCLRNLRGKNKFINGTGKIAG